MGEEHAPSLAALDHLALIVAIAGLAGDSEWSPEADYGLDAYLRDVESVIDPAAESPHGQREERLCA